MSLLLLAPAERSHLGARVTKSSLLLNIAPKQIVQPVLITSGLDCKPLPDLALLEIDDMLTSPASWRVAFLPQAVPHGLVCQPLHQAAMDEPRARWYAAWQRSPRRIGQLFASNKIGCHDR